jgi:hypothetical protein
MSEQKLDISNMPTLSPERPMDVEWLVAHLQMIQERYGNLPVYLADGAPILCPRVADVGGKPGVIITDRID